MGKKKQGAGNATSVLAENGALYYSLRLEK